MRKVRNRGHDPSGNRKPLGARHPLPNMEDVASPWREGLKWKPNGTTSTAELRWTSGPQRFYVKIEPPARPTWCCAPISKVRNHPWRASERLPGPCVPWAP